MSDWLNARGRLVNVANVRAIERKAVRRRDGSDDVELVADGLVIRGGDAKGADAVIEKLAVQLRATSIEDLTDEADSWSKT